MPLYNQNKHKEALEYLKKAYEIRTKNLPYHHPDVLKELEWMQSIEEELRQRRENNTEP